MELWDEERRLSEVKPFQPMLKVVPIPVNKEEKIMKSNISYLIGKGNKIQLSPKAACAAGNRRNSTRRPSSMSVQCCALISWSERTLLAQRLVC